MSGYLPNTALNYFFASLVIVGFVCLIGTAAYALFFIG